MIWETSGIEAKRATVVAVVATAFLLVHVGKSRKGWYIIVMTFLNNKSEPKTPAVKQGEESKLPVEDQQIEGGVGELVSKMTGEDDDPDDNHPTTNSPPSASLSAGKVDNQGCFPFQPAGQSPI